MTFDLVNWNWGLACPSQWQHRGWYDNCRQMNRQEGRGREVKGVEVLPKPAE
jgi:hypothetical protein